MMNLKEAIKQGKLKEFAAEHEPEDPHPEGDSRFWRLLSLIAGSSSSEGTLNAECDEGSDDTQTQADISEGV